MKYRQASKQGDTVLSEQIDNCTRTYKIGGKSHPHAHQTQVEIQNENLQHKAYQHHTNILRIRVKTNLNHVGTCMYIPRQSMYDKTRKPVPLGPTPAQID